MEYKFSELFTWTSGKPVDLSDGTVPVYGSNGIIGYTDYAKYSNRIILGRVGAYCGSVEYCKEDFNATDNTLITTCDTSRITYHYAYYLLKLMGLNKYAGGSAQPLITQGLLKHLKCDIPNVLSQDRVVDTLSAYDELIENNNKRIKILEQMAENLYKEWFVRFRFPGHEDVEFDCENPRGWIFGDREQTFKPKQWHYGELKELGEFKRGKNITADKMIEGEIPVISAGISPSGMHNEANVLGKSLTISASGANAGYLLYHLNDIWAADCSFYQNEKNIWFVYNSLKFLQPVLSNLQAGAAQPHVYPKHVNRISMTIPSEEWVKKYCDAVDSMYEQIFVLKQKNQNLIKQRDLLLPRLMSGNLK